MISDDVRSTNGRPSASTPVTERGTACTIRVLRRFLNSVFVLVTPSDTISVVSSAKLPPESFMQPGAVPHSFPISSQRLALLQLLRCAVLRSAFRGRFAVRSRQEHPCFLRNPYRPNQQIDRSLEKCRTVSLNAVAEKEKYPASQKKSSSPNPFHEKEKNNSGKNHGDANSMQKLVPAGFVLAIVLRHVVRQARHERTSCRP